MDQQAKARARLALPALRLLDAEADPLAILHQGETDPVAGRQPERQQDQQQDEGRTAGHGSLRKWKRRQG
ncbi:hypothetical protein FQZ97_1061430 [compost metagenome]